MPASDTAVPFSPKIPRPPQIPGPSEWLSVETVEAAVDVNPAQKGAAL